MVNLTVQELNAILKYKKYKKQKRKNKKRKAQAKKIINGAVIGGLKSDSSQMVGYGQNAMTNVSNTASDIQALQRQLLEKQLKNSNLAIQDDPTKKNVIDRFDKQPNTNNLLTKDEYINNMSKYIQRFMTLENKTNQLLFNKNYPEEDLIRNEENKDDVFVNYDDNYRCS